MRQLADTELALGVAQQRLSRRPGRAKLVALAG